MRYPAEETAAKHQRILEGAAQLFRDRGFDGVSIPEIMESAGLTHGSFYNHFESKNALMNACISHGAEKSLADVADSPPTARGKSAYIGEYLSKSHRDDPASGCFMAAIGSEARRQPAAFEAMTLFIRSYINRLAEQFPWSTKRHARREAIRMTASMVGGMILARAVHDEALSEEILREVAAGIRLSFRSA